MGSKKGICRGPYKKLQHELQSLSVKQYTCAKCNKSYKRKIILLHHIRTKHLNYCAPCPLCGRRFSAVAMCNRHIKNVHKLSNSKYKISLQTDVSVSKTPNEEKRFNISENSQFGRHIIASCDIEIGQTVIKTSAFATIEYISSVRNICFTCGDLWHLEFFRCPYCINIWFCSKVCSKNKVHTAMCNDTFNSSDCSIVRLATEIIRVASKMFPSE